MWTDTQFWRRYSVATIGDCLEIFLKSKILLYHSVSPQDGMFMDIGHLCWPVALVPVRYDKLTMFLEILLAGINIYLSIPYVSANSHALVTHVLTPHRCSLFSSLNTCLTILVSGRSWSLFTYDRTFIWQYIIGGIWQHSPPTTITLLVVGFTFRAQRIQW